MTEFIALPAGCTSTSFLFKTSIMRKDTGLSKERYSR